MWVRGRARVWVRGRGRGRVWVRGRARVRSIEAYRLSSSRYEVGVVYVIRRRLAMKSAPTSLAE